MNVFRHSTRHHNIETETGSKPSEVSS